MSDEAIVREKAQESALRMEMISKIQYPPFMRDVYLYKEYSMFNLWLDAFRHRGIGKKGATVVGVVGPYMRPTT